MGFFGAGVASSLIGGGLSLIGGLRANSSAKSAAREMMDFQERMTRRAHRYEVNDLRAAGLNPRLSAMGGSGAHVPPGAMAPVHDAITPAVSTALTARMNRAQVENLQEQNKHIKAETMASVADAALKISNAKVADNKASIMKPWANIGEIGGDITSGVKSFYHKFKSNPGGTEFPNPLKLLQRLRSGGS